MVGGVGRGGGDLRELARDLGAAVIEKCKAYNIDKDASNNLR